MVVLVVAVRYVINVNSFEVRLVGTWLEYILCGPLNVDDIDVGASSFSPKQIRALFLVFGYTY